MRALIYTRASLDRTGEGKSNSRQRDECLRLTEYKRWDTVQVDGQPSIDDISISAYGEKERPGWNKVLAMIEAGEVDVVVAWHLDRLTRNMADLEKLILLCEKHNVAVTTATGDMDLTTDTGRMIARILAAVARQEVERKAARQRLAHVQRREEGRPWTGVKMLGYDRQGGVVEEEAAAIRQAMEDVLEERASLAELGRRWRELGLTSPYQKDATKPWTPRGVKKVLTNPRLAGFITVTPRGGAPEVLGEGNWKPIVDEATLTLVTAKLSDSERVSGAIKKGRIASNLLTGIMRCAKCGGGVRAGSKRGVPAYLCNEWHVGVPREEADELVRSAFVAAIALARPESIVSGSARGRMDADTIASEVDALQRRKEMLTRSFTRGAISEASFESAVDEANAEISRLTGEAEGLGREINWQQVRTGSVASFLAQPMSEQRRMLTERAEVTLHPAPGRRSSARSQVEVKVKAKRGKSEVWVPAHVPA